MSPAQPLLRGRHQPWWWLVISGAGLVVLVVTELKKVLTRDGAALSAR
ncbi:MAG: hypothetical protein ACOZQL_25400 [Myxococcota bacterium]